MPFGVNAELFEGALVIVSPTVQGGIARNADNRANLKPIALPPSLLLAGEPKKIAKSTWVDNNARIEAARKIPIY